jgi:hypothetical protein
MKFSELPTELKVMTLVVIAFILLIVSVLIYGIFDKTPARVSNYGVQTIDSCEYIISDFCKSRSVTHKGNCKFCQLRNSSKDSIK